MRIKSIYYFLITICIVFVYSCKPKSDKVYNAFTQKPSGIYYQLISLGDGNFTPQKGDSLMLAVIFKNDKGEIVYNSEKDSYLGYVGAKIKERIKFGTLDECFSMLNEGDSAHFKLSAAVVYFNMFSTALPSNVAKNSTLLVEAKLFNIKTNKELRVDSISCDMWCKEMLEVENAYISDYILKNNITQLPDSNGIIILKRTVGKGAKISGGKPIFVHYIGKLLNGKIIDDTYRTKEPLEYKLGTPDQVIDGFEILIRTMRIGEKAEVLIPSNLAFGRYGSSTGIIPPYSPVIYQIEIIK